MLMFKERRPAIRTLRGWAISVLQEAGAIAECELHGWMLDRPIRMRAGVLSTSPANIRPQGSLRTKRSPRSRRCWTRSVTPARIARPRSANKRVKLGCSCALGLYLTMKKEVALVVVTPPGTFLFFKDSKRIPLTVRGGMFPCFARGIYARLPAMSNPSCQFSRIYYQAISVAIGSMAPSLHADCEPWGSGTSQPQSRPSRMALQANIRSGNVRSVVSLKGPPSLTWGPRRVTACVASGLRTMIGGSSFRCIDGFPVSPDWMPIAPKTGPYSMPQR